MVSGDTPCCQEGALEWSTVDEVIRHAVATGPAITIEGSTYEELKRTTKRLTTSLSTLSKPHPQQVKAMPSTPKLKLQGESNSSESRGGSDKILLISMVTVPLLLIVLGAVLVWKFMFAEDASQPAAGKKRIVLDGAEVFPFRRDKLFGYMSATGSILVPPKFVSASPFSEGFARVYDGQSWSFIDNTISNPFEQTWSGVESFSQGRAAVQLSKNVWAFIDTSGKVVIPGPFSQVRSFVNGRAAVKVGERWGMIDLTGKMVIEPKFGWMGDFREGKIRVKTRSGPAGKWFYVDAMGQQAIDFSYEVAGDFSEGRAAVRSGGKWGIIDTEGRWVVKPMFGRIPYEFEGEGPVARFSEGLLAARLGDAQTGRWGFINREGAWAIEPRFLAVDLAGFSEGLAGVKEGEFWTFIDQTGKAITDRPLKDILPFYRGLAPVNHRAYYLTRNGTLISGK